jgi:hypothetical protein
MNARFALLVVAGTVASFISGAQAGTVTFELTTEFSGGQTPTSPGPWGTAVFDDGGGTGSVTLTITNHLAGDASAFVTGWYFNFDPSLNLSALSITGGRGVGGDSINIASNAFQADGDGLYDILLGFRNSGPPSLRFNENDSTVFTIMSSEAITAFSFDFLSAPGGGHGPFTHVGRIQGTGVDNNGSGWFTGGEPPMVPLPAASLAGLVTLVGMIGARGSRRRR